MKTEATAGPVQRGSMMVRKARALWRGLPALLGCWEEDGCRRACGDIGPGELERMTVGMIVFRPLVLQLTGILQLMLSCGSDACCTFASGEARFYNVGSV